MPRMPTPARSIILDAARNKTGRHLARVAGRASARPTLRLSHRRTVCSPRGSPLQSEQAGGGPVRHRDCAASRLRLSHRCRLRSHLAPEGPVVFRDRRRRHGAEVRRHARRISTGRAISRSATRGTSTVIYELHVRGYTIHPSAGVRLPGDVSRADREDPVSEGPRRHRGRADAGPGVQRASACCASIRITGEPLKNYWGYDPLGFFAPKASYASVRAAGAQVLEFKEMVRAFHAAGIEVILDVVFNHTVRRQRAGPDGLLSRDRQRDLLLAGRRQALLPRLHRHGTHDQRGASGGARSHPRRAALLGDGDARRRLPLRPRLGARPRPRRSRPGRRAACWSGSPRIRSCATPS